MKTIALFSALALGALTSVAMAEPVQLTDGQMDKIVAGNCGVPDDQGCTVGGFNNGQGAAFVVHASGDHTNTCTPAGCKFRSHPGTGDTHMFVVPKNNK